ncbi:hypothetical protein FKX85_08210 [Echinicola soli]|uniref:Secreted protein n=1 Tax=Echinicola soli TaxID=2591634 RepID=A0A514CGW9_9BACT|nr:hypothetical protein [Echinicola soli]QDH79020.1 hypothetical protein FKX85_08210 [Echinicola soli]
MKKKRVLPRVLMAASVTAMGVGVFQVFDAEAQTTGGGWHCEEVSPGTWVCDNEDGESVGWHDSTPQGDGSCKGAPNGCRIVF